MFIHTKSNIFKREGLRTVVSKALKRDNLSDLSYRKP